MPARHETGRIAVRLYPALAAAGTEGLNSRLTEIERDLASTIHVQLLTTVLASGTTTDMSTTDLFAGLCDVCRLRYTTATQRSDLDPATMAVNHAATVTAAASGTVEGSSEAESLICCLCEGILPSLLKADTITAIAALIPSFDASTITLGVVLPSSVTLNEFSFQLYLSTQYDLALLPFPLANPLSCREVAAIFTAKPVFDVKDTAKLLLQSQLAPVVPYNMTTDSTLKATLVELCMQPLLLQIHHVLSCLIMSYHVF